MRVFFMDSDLKFEYSDNDLTSKYAHEKEFLLVIENPQTL